MLWVVALVAAAGTPPIEPVPDWVERREIPAAPAGADGQSLLLLRDTQVRVGKTVERFERYAWKVLRQGGVEELAHQDFEWDPAYEQLALHGMWIIRDGQRRDAWHPDDAHVAQREARLDQEGIYDGRLTLMAELRDLRPGDVVEVAATTRGENPIYKGHFADSQVQGFNRTVALDAFRLVWERARPLTLQLRGGAQSPRETVEGSRRVYSWELRDVPARTFEYEVPDDFDQVPRVELSDWKSWAEVAVGDDAVRRGGAGRARSRSGEALRRAAGGRPAHRHRALRAGRRALRRRGDWRAFPPAALAVVGARARLRRLQGQDAAVGVAAPRGRNRRGARARLLGPHAEAAIVAALGVRVQPRHRPRARGRERVLHRPDDDASPRLAREHGESGRRRRADRPRGVHRPRPPAAVSALAAELGRAADLDARPRERGRADHRDHRARRARRDPAPRGDGAPAPGARRGPAQAARGDLRA